MREGEREGAEREGEQEGHAEHRSAGLSETDCEADSLRARRVGGAVGGLLPPLRGLSERFVEVREASVSLREQPEQVSYCKKQNYAIFKTFVSKHCSKGVRPHTVVWYLFLSTRGDAENAASHQPCSLFSRSMVEAGAVGGWVFLRPDELSSPFTKCLRGSIQSQFISTANLDPMPCNLCYPCPLQPPNNCSHAVISCPSASVTSLSKASDFAAHDRSFGLLKLSVFTAHRARTACFFVHSLANFAQTPVPCSAGCGAVYCGEACRRKCWDAGHSVLCLGLVEEEEHPLVQHKVGAFCPRCFIWLSVFAAVVCYLGTWCRACIK